MSVSWGYEDKVGCRGVGNFGGAYTPPDCQFVTSVVAVFDEDTQVLRWARGGAPYPILLRPGREPQEPKCLNREPAWHVELLKSDGPLLGVVPRAKFS